MEKNCSDLYFLGNVNDTPSKRFDLLVNAHLLQNFKPLERTMTDEWNGCGKRKAYGMIANTKKRKEHGRMTGLSF